MIGLPWITGACRGAKAKLFFFGCAAMATANYLLTDFNSEKENDEAYGVEDVRSVAEESLEPLLRT
jgi:hypothetical protein